MLSSWTNLLVSPLHKSFFSAEASVRWAAASYYLPYRTGPTVSSSRSESHCLSSGSKNHCYNSLQDLIDYWWTNTETSIYTVTGPDRLSQAQPTQGSESRCFSSACNVVKVIWAQFVDKICLFNHSTRIVVPYCTWGTGGHCFCSGQKIHCCNSLRDLIIDDSALWKMIKILRIHFDNVIIRGI